MEITYSQELAVAPATYMGTRAWAETQTQWLEGVLEQRVSERTAELLARYEHVQRLAQTLQRALLLAPSHSAFLGLAVEAASEMASTEELVGGDFYDAFSLNTGEVALILGDVCGKGMVAALRVPEIKFALRAFLSQYPSPARALSCLNDWLCVSRNWDHDPLGTFATAAVVVLDALTGRGMCGLAGAEAPHLLHTLGRPDRVTATGTALGVAANQYYETRTFELGPGDLLLMTTDGITEARRDNVFLGDVRLTDLAMQAWQDADTGRAVAVAQSVLEGARRFAGGTLQDDATVLAAERRPA